MSNLLAVTSILNRSLLEEGHIVRYLQSNKKIIQYVEVVLLAENNTLFQQRDRVLAYQNTNKENYPDIAKDFLLDVNKSADLIVKAIIELKKDSVMSSIFVDEIKLVGHTINIKSASIESTYIPTLFQSYIKEKEKEYIEILKLFDFMERGNLGKLSQKIFTKAKLDLGRIVKDHALWHPLMVRSKIGDILEKIDLELYKGRFPEAIKYIEVILKEDPCPYHYLYHSSNLIEEKIIKKKNVCYPIVYKGIKEDFISIDSGAVLKNSVKVSYTIIEIDVSIGYYLKKEMIVGILGKDIIFAMSTIKDYLARDRFMLETIGELSNYDAEHPSTIQNNARKDFNMSTEALQESYSCAQKVIRKVANHKGWECLYRVEEWRRVLRGIELFAPEKNNTHYSAFEVRQGVESAAKDSSWNIFNKAETGVLGEAFMKTVYEEYEIHNFIKKILDSAYSKIEYKINIDTQIILGFHDRATFHTTLKDSFVIDFRNEERGSFSPLAEKLIKEDEEVRNLAKTMKKHPYHNYYELDRDMFMGKERAKIPLIKIFLENSAKLSPAVEYRCALKFRKLGNYKAYGIYFSHTKTMGIDYRKGKKSYTHELAHHIDLSSYSQDRRKIVSLLLEYFRKRITKKEDYYLRDEELIARAAEIALLLKASNYKKLKIEIKNKETLLNQMKQAYDNSLEIVFMSTWEEYFNAEEYLDIPHLIESGDTSIIEIIEEYFLSFWSNDISTTMKIKDMSVAYDSNMINKYPKSHHSYNYYLCDIYNIMHTEVSIKEYMNELFILE